MIKPCENREIRKVKKKKKRYERFFRKTKKNIKFRFKISKFFVYSITVYIQAPPEFRIDRNGRAKFTRPEEVKLRRTGKKFDKLIEKRYVLSLRDRRSKERKEETRYIRTFSTRTFSTNVECQAK